MPASHSSKSAGRQGNDATSEALNIIGDVENRTAIVFDDEIDTAGTVTQAAQLLQGAGVLDILVCCVHGVFSDPAIERLKDSAITEIVTTDTVPLPPEKSLDQAHRFIGCPIACSGNRTHPRGRLGRRIVHVATGSYQSPAELTSLWKSPTITPGRFIFTFVRELAWKSGANGRSSPPNRILRVCIGR